MKLNKPECAVAASIVIFGIAMACFGSFYGVGSLENMGAGYFPVLLGITTAAAGIAVLLEVRHSDTPAPEIPWRAFICVFSALLIWALLVEHIGLFPSSMLLVILGSLGRNKVRMRAMILTALIASAASVVIFIEGFELPLRAIAW
ncbi:tripartite tricarboxylate transporter TctB family protein [Mesorhizobium sp. CA13]|uniref:tripartite tricarboxylate transporter TctB family protein n=1 Tax=unclassified Mesorhizobium TaxID=325217 RepID=UPI001128CEF4|nr:MULTISPECIES: tripartite tricarboxylate transporter TctB family protein [unclassified Mesorhizobium]MBZ9853521.1 tripartite tricarboxylate transporter TctB family protein [Mesorhizobium sp. CA13]MBZ9964634.1 tripartite tricarboxylate transporter TctB family protein [Mesorhizobium sp. BR1-1-2]TPJ57500.1 tripartite tricarboxylate transporter TctB family protein [Mesorhizobium sp. B2-6-1]